MTDRILTIVEGHRNLPINTDNVLLWDSFEESSGVKSIPRMIEDQGMELRSEYLNWTATLASSVIDEVTLSEHFSIDLLNCASYWWQTLIADKSPYRTKGIYNVMRLRVIEKKMISEGYRKLVYVGDDKILAKVLKRWLKIQNLEFTWVYKKREKTAVSTSKRLYVKLPLILQSVTYFAFFVLKRLRFSKHFKPNQNAMCTIVTYFPGIDLKKAGEGEFYSNYWGPLHNLIKQENISVNWIWIYTNLRQLTFKESVDFQTRLNNLDRNGNERYLLMEDFLNFHSIWKAVVCYIKLLHKYFIYKKAASFFIFPNSKLNFFAILKRDWKESFVGHTALMNCIQMAVFDQASKQLPLKTKLILYVWENQPWEQSLLSMRSKLSDSLFVGLVHTPANCALFNLKVFPGNAMGIFSTQTGRSIPDILAAPGDKSKTILVNGGWPSDRVQTFEALRYITSLKPINHMSCKNEQNKRNILVATGSIQTETEIQIELLSLAEKKGALKFYSKLIIKPHPLIPVEDIVKKANFQIEYEIVYEAVSELWGESHVVYTSNSTSVSLEAAYHGIPVIIVGASDNLNLNALFGTDDVEFIHSADELVEKLVTISFLVKPKRDFFELNPRLPKWARLLRDHGFPHTSDLVI
jgi:surface carbohydrate biosynthesis protein (TIGR04326 family)